MDFRALKSFRAVAEVLHFRKAAQQVGVTQPALSQQIARLEEELGAKLFERDRRTVRLTVAGQTLLDETQGLLEQVQRAVAATRQVGGLRDKTLRVGQLQYISHAFLPPGIKSLKKARPEVLVELVEMPPHEVVRGVRDGRVDVGFAMNPLQPADDLVTREVVRGHWAVWLKADHPLAELETVPIAQLVKEPLVLFDRPINPHTYDLLMRSLRSHGPQVRVAHHVQQPQHGVPLVLQGLGCFLVGSYVIQDAPRGAVMRPVTGMGGDLRIYAVWKPGERAEVLRPFLSGLPSLSPRGGRGSGGSG